MDKERFSKLLLEQKEKGRSLITLISTMHESQNDFGDGMAMFGGEDLYYVPEDELNSFLNKFEGWKSYVSELLKSQFGRDDQFVYDWDSNIGTYISKRKPILPQLKKKVDKGLSLIDSFLERLDIHFHGDVCVDEIIEKDNMTKHPKIFISHKTEDKPFVNELVRMLEFIIGTDQEKLFCSSIAGYDIKPGREILAELKRQFNDYEIFLIIVHSPRYYESPICLNEMGAAWVLGTKFCSFLTDDCKFSMLKGAIDGKYLSIKVNDNFDTVTSKLNYLKDELLQVFGIDNFNQNRWETIRNEFIQRTQNIDYATITAKEEKNKQPEPKANIVADVISTKPLIVDITNRGDGIAEELKLQLDEAGSGLIITGLDAFPLEYLKPDKHVKLSVYPCISDPESFKVFFKWTENGVEFSSEDIVVL